MMRERRQSFADWNLAMNGHSRNSTDNISVHEKHEKYLNISREVRELLYTERKMDHHRLSKLISKKGNRSSSIFWDEAKGEPVDQGITTLRDKSGQLISVC